MLRRTARVCSAMSSTVSAKPLERIGEIKILHVDGLGAVPGASGDGVSDQVMSSALKYRLQAPLVDSLLNAAGIKPVAGGSGLKDAIDRKD